MSQNYSLGLAACFGNEFNELGGKIVAEIRCKTGDRDFSGQINRIKMAKPDVVYSPVYYMECALIARQARDMGLDVPFIAADAVQFRELVELGERSVEDLLFTTYFREGLLDTEIGNKFRNMFKEKTGRQPQASESLGAEAYLVVLNAISRAGSANPEMIREALAAASNREGITSSICVQMCVNDHRYLVVSQVKEGRFVHFSGTNSWELFRQADSP